MTDLEKNWKQLNQLTVGLLGDCEHLILPYQRLFERYRNDIVVDAQTTILGLYRAPGSKDRHHDFEGGLVAHMLEMWSIYEWIVPMLKSMDLKPFGSSNIWRGIIHHDLNKIHRYKRLQQTPWMVDYADDRANDLLGSAQKSLAILIEMNLAPNILLHNALITSEGGYSKSRPKNETALAKMLYLLDDMSANVVDRLRSGRFWDSQRAVPNAIK